MPLAVAASAVASLPRRRLSDTPTALCPPAQGCAPRATLGTHPPHTNPTGVAARKGGAKSPLEWTLYGLGLLATIAVTIHLTRMARKALAGAGLAPDASAAEEEV